MISIAIHLHGLNQNREHGIVIHVAKKLCIGLMEFVIAIIIGKIIYLRIKMSGPSLSSVSVQPSVTVDRGDSNG